MRRYRPGGFALADYQGLRTITGDSGREIGFLPRSARMAEHHRDTGFLKRCFWSWPISLRRAVGLRE